MKEHFILLARYNAWANRRVYDAAASVSPQALDQDVGAYGGSIIATLNHLLLVDRNWLAQLSDGGEAADTLDEVLFDDLAELREARELEDERLIALTERLKDADLHEKVRYHTVRQPLVEELPLGCVLTHVFTHQIHHRGEMWVALSRIGATVKSYDMLCFQRETGAKMFARVA